QRVVFRHVFSPRVLARVQNNALKADRADKPLTLDELFRGVTDAVWKETVTQGKDDKKRTLDSSVVRRNLQREHLKDLSNLVVGARASAAPPDARSLARFHLRGIDRTVRRLLDDKTLVLDDTTRAHLEECQERIAKVLGASMQVTQP